VWTNDLILLIIYTSLVQFRLQNVNTPTSYTIYYVLFVLNAIEPRKKKFVDIYPKLLKLSC